MEGVEKATVLRNQQVACSSGTTNVVGKSEMGIEENPDSVGKTDLGPTVPRQCSDVRPTRMAGMNVQKGISCREPY